MARGRERRPAQLVVERVRATTRGRTVVLVDGPSAAGKSTLAGEIAYELNAQLLPMTAFRPGPGGLEVASSVIAGSVLADESPGYHRWDAETGQLAEWHKVNPKRHLVIEGAGALSAANRERASFGVWVHLPFEERRLRQFQRDGVHDPELWEYCTLQERAFFQRERPDQLADVIYDSGADILVD
jgi:uridine kinase